MSTSALGFAVADEDRPLLDELVQYVGQGNLAEQGLTLDDIPAVTRRILKDRP